MDVALSEILSFAIVGHPNEGKSSVVSTLAERDDIRISSTPGETEYAVQYTLEIDRNPLICFLDTPGFQMPKKTLRWLSRRSGDDDAKTISDDFEREFAHQSSFVHDSRILQAIADTDGLLYVIDASKPPGDDDFAEMEILRQLGKTRMAVLNSKGDDSRYREEWKATLNRHFNSVRRFNAREAGFNERIRLLEALKLTEQHWEGRLDGVIKILHADRKGRMTRAVDIICSLVQESMSKTMQTSLKNHENIKKVQDSLMTAYTDWLRQRESEAQRYLRKEFHHRQFEMEIDDEDLKDYDLFAKETWRVLGLGRRQLATVSAIAGALTGAVAGLPLSVGGIIFGIFIAGGAVLGGISGFAGSRPLSRAHVNIAGMKHRLGHCHVEIGPSKSVQLACILIDRSLLYLDTVNQWAHAKREKADSTRIMSSLSLTTQWSRKDQTVVSHFVSRISRGKTVRKELEALRRVLISIISRNRKTGIDTSQNSREHFLIQP